MARIELDKADLALIADMATYRVTIPTLMASAPTRRYDGTSVRFAGDEYGTPFRGEGKAKEWALTARYGVDDQAALKDLLDLLDLAADSADPRLLLRTHYGLVEGLNESTAVVVFEVQPVPQQGRYYDVAFTAVAVNWTPAV